MKIKTLSAACPENQTVLLRVDYNVPILNGKITENTRIKESLPTIYELLAKNNKIVILSHLGRPDGKKNPEFSLQPVATELSVLLNKPVIFLEDCLGAENLQTINSASEKSIFMLENLRFYPEEEAGDAWFARQLANLGTFFVLDAFGAAHRAHASISEIAKILPHCGGLLMSKEVEALNTVQEPEKPFLVIIGGAKVETKARVIENLAKKADYILIGGGLANTFLLAQGKNIGNSYHQPEYIETCHQLLNKFPEKLILPIDFVMTSDQLSNNSASRIDSQLSEKEKIVDIGPKTISKFAEYIGNAKTIVWNGPMGVFEYQPFKNGTQQLIKFLVNSTFLQTKVIIGGGDSLSALAEQNITSEYFYHVSTGGGAMLEFLEGKKLPGIEALK